MRACVGACVRPCLRACVPACLRACVHLCAHVCARACVRVRVFVRVCGCMRVHVVAASAPPQRSTDNRHWADVRFAECWGLSAHDRDGDAAGAPRVRWPGPHGGHRWGAEPCRTFIHTAPENPTWHNPTTAALQVSLSLLALLSALPNNTYGHVAAHCEALTRHIMTAIRPSQDATDIP